MKNQNPKPRNEGLPDEAEQKEYLGHNYKRVTKAMLCIEKIMYAKHTSETVKAKAEKIHWELCALCDAIIEGVE